MNLKWATSSHRNDEFFKACSGSEIEVCRWPFGEVLASPKAETFSISSPSIQLSLGGLLSSRAHLCLTGQSHVKALSEGGQIDSKTVTHVRGRICYLCT
jgi:hypothetical protein